MDGKKMSKKKKQNKKIRDSYPTKTLKELSDEGRVPEYFHLFDHVEMKEWQAKQPGYKEWEKKIREREDKEGPNANLGV